MQVREKIRTYLEVDNMICSYFECRSKIDPEWQILGRALLMQAIQSILIEDDQITVTVVYDDCDDCSAGWGPADTKDFTFPSSHLWANQADLMRGFKAKAEEAARAKEQAKEEARERTEQREQAKYAELRAKYGDLPHSSE